MLNKTKRSQQTEKKNFRSRLKRLKSDIGKPLLAREGVEELKDRTQVSAISSASSPVIVISVLLRSSINKVRV